MDTTQAKIEIIDYYQSLLQSEINNHSNITIILLTITIILLGVTWWWNKKGAVAYIDKHIKKQFNDSQKDIEKSLNDSLTKKIKTQFIDIESNMIILEADVYRSLYLTSKQGKIYSRAIFWASKAIKCYLDTESNQKLIRYLTDSIVILIVKMADKKEVHQLDKVKKIIEELPDLLIGEKNEILKFLEGCKNDPA